MADKSRERNMVDLFSDYGLDERQKDLSNKIGFDCFRTANGFTVLLTAIWLAVSIVEGMPEIHPAFAALSYFGLMMIFRWVYAIRASKNGIINQITAFGSTTRTVIAEIILFAAIIIFSIYSIFVDTGAEDTEFLAVFIAFLAIDRIVMYVCGKRNFKTLDEQTQEDEEE